MVSVLNADWSAAVKLVIDSSVVNLCVHVHSCCKKRLLVASRSLLTCDNALSDASYTTL